MRRHIFLCAMCATSMWGPEFLTSMLVGWASATHWLHCRWIVRAGCFTWLLQALTQPTSCAMLGRGVTVWNLIAWLTEDTSSSLIAASGRAVVLRSRRANLWQSSSAATPCQRREPLWGQSWQSWASCTGKMIHARSVQEWHKAKAPEECMAFAASS